MSNSTYIATLNSESYDGNDNDDDICHKEKATLSTADLLSYGLQVARGMEFLASKDVSVLVYKYQRINKKN